MPRGPVHDLIEKALLGKVTRMSRVMDAPAAELKARHRAVLHDPASIALLSIQMADAEHSVAENFAAGLLHVAVDNLFAQFNRRPGRKPGRKAPARAKAKKKVKASGRRV